MSESQAGKGDRPRNNHSPRFRSNYDEINWTKPKKPKKTSKNNEQR